MFLKLINGFESPVLSRAGSADPILLAFQLTIRYDIKHLHSQLNKITALFLSLHVLFRAFISLM